MSSPQPPTTDHLFTKRTVPLPQGSVVVGRTYVMIMLRT